MGERSTVQYTPKVKVIKRYQQWRRRRRKINYTFNKPNPTKYKLKPNPTMKNQPQTPHKWLKSQQTHFPNPQYNTKVIKTPVNFIQKQSNFSTAQQAEIPDHAKVNQAQQETTM